MIAAGGFDRVTDGYAIRGMKFRPPFGSTFLLPLTVTNGMETVFQGHEDPPFLKSPNRPSAGTGSSAV